MVAIAERTRVPTARSMWLSGVALGMTSGKGKTLLANLRDLRKLLCIVHKVYELPLFLLDPRVGRVVCAVWLLLRVCGPVPARAVACHAHGTQERVASKGRHVCACADSYICLVCGFTSHRTERKKII